MGADGVHIGETIINKQSQKRKIEQQVGHRFMTSSSISLPVFYVYFVKLSLRVKRVSFWDVHNFSEEGWPAIAGELNSGVKLGVDLKSYRERSFSAVPISTLEDRPPNSAFKIGQIFWTKGSVLT